MWLGALVLGAIGTVACHSSKPATAAAPRSSYGQNLSLALSLGNSLTAGATSVKAEFSLTNNGAAAFDGCFGPAWGVSVIVGGSYDAGHFVRDNHPSCVEKFTVVPGQKIVWSKKVPLTDLRAGWAKITGWVKLVDPASCDQYHVCHETSIASPAMTVAVAER